MNITDFFLSVGASWIAGFLPKPNPAATGVHDQPSAPPTAGGHRASSPILFEPISDWFGAGQQGRLGSLLKALQQSNVYFLIERTPSTAWNLVTAVVEDARTGDWYPFARDLALQGSGGGFGNTERFAQDVQAARAAGADIRVSIRVAETADLHLLRNGEAAWPEVKERSIPALIAADPKFNELRERLIKIL